MAAALEQAKRGIGQTSPNPAVGAVLVVDGEVVAAGYHRGAGKPHAEVECLAAVRGRVPARAVLYVTLEPCSTVGRTGACTDAIIAAGVREIVVGAVDPNPRHAGRGIEILRESGAQVRSGVLADECTALNEAFNKWIRTGVPFVIAKCGMSLDARLTRVPGEARCITSAAARRHAQQLRASVDAILVGAETVRADNPRLTVRGVYQARQPWRVVLSRSGRLPRTAIVFTDRHSDRTLVFGRTTIRSLLRQLGERDITSVLIEGGGEILGQALDARAIDKVQIYVGGIISGGAVPAFAGRGAATASEAPRLAGVSYQQIGNDLCISGYPEWHERPTAK